MSISFDLILCLGGKDFKKSNEFIIIVIEEKKKLWHWKASIKWQAKWVKVDYVIAEHAKHENN